MKWKTANGTEISIRDMTDAHLVNAIARLQRTLTNIAQREFNAVRQVMMLPPPNGEHALDLYESGIEDLLMNGYEDPRREGVEKWIDILKAEQARRSGLPVGPGTDFLGQPVAR